MTHEDYAKYQQTMVSWLEKYNTMPSLKMMVEQYREELQPLPSTSVLYSKYSLCF